MEECGPEVRISKAEDQTASAVPQNYEGIVNLITRDYPSLSPGYQQIARFFTQNPNTIALESINAIAEKCGVHPSSLVRFAQNLGYSGFKQLQGVFQTRLATAAPGFRERISALDAELSRKEANGNKGFLKDLVVRDMASLQGLLEGVTEEALAAAAKHIVAAQTIYIGAVALRTAGAAAALSPHHAAPEGDPARSGGWAGAGNGADHGRARRADRHRVPALCQGGRGDHADCGGLRDAGHRHHQFHAVAAREEGGGTVHYRRTSIPSRARWRLRMSLVQCLATSAAALLQPDKGLAPRIQSVTEIAQNQKARLPRPAPAAREESGDEYRT